jgi:nitrate reductase NapAB chaperone NapD
MSTRALLLARTSDPESLVPVADILEHSEIVDCWNAVDGHVDLVAKLNAPPAALVQEIWNVGGIDSVEVLELSDETGSILCDPTSCYSFVFLEVEPEKRSTIREQLSALKEVGFCSSRDDGAELVAVVNGASFQSINRAVNEQIRQIDGVLRLKQDRVINLKNI